MTPGQQQIMVTKKIPIGSTNINIEFLDNEATLTNQDDPKVSGADGPDLFVYVSLVENIRKDTFIKVLVTNEQEIREVRYLKPDLGSLEIMSIGGKGGVSKYGGTGGDGGDITVYQKEDAAKYYYQIYYTNYGGDGGELWRPIERYPDKGETGEVGELKFIRWE
jgi:hypothetical protein